MQQRKQPQSAVSRSVILRCAVVATVSLVAFGVIVYRLVQLQIIDKDNYRHSCVVNKNTCINSANEIAKTIKGLIEYCIKGKKRCLIENKTMILLSGENEIGPTFILE